MTTPDQPDAIPRDAAGKFTTADDGPLDLASARKLRAENHSLRTRLHELEGQHAELTTDHERAVTQLAARDYAEVERLASEHLVDPADIWRQEPDLQKFYDSEFKAITADKVAEVAQALAAAKPHLAKPPQGPPPAPPTDRPLEGLRSGALPETAAPAEPSWYTAIRGGG